MPYRVPDTFFDNVENKIIASTQMHAKKHNILKIMYRSAAAAAALALLFVAGNHETNHESDRHKTDFDEIAQAFDNLSDSDQTYLLEIYQNDIFFNE